MLLNKSWHGQICKAAYLVVFKWLKKSGITAAKDEMTIEQFYKRENQTEEKVYKVRDAGAELARKLLD